MQINASIVARHPDPQPWAPELMQAPSSAHLKILIVNEDMRSADSLKHTLQELGYPAILTAYSARRALVAAAEFSPAVVILDLELPDMTGYQLAGRFRSHLQRHVRQAPLLAIAEQREPLDTERARAAGFVGCLNKPVMPLELQRILRRLQGHLN